MAADVIPYDLLDGVKRKPGFLHQFYSGKFALVVRIDTCIVSSVTMVRFLKSGRVAP